MRCRYRSRSSSSSAGQGMGQCLVSRALVQNFARTVRTVGAAYAVCACTVYGGYGGGAVCV